MKAGGLLCGGLVLGQVEHADETNGLRQGDVSPVVSSAVQLPSALMVPLARTAVFFGLSAQP